ncbi:MAG: GldL-related protein, partial [Sphingobacteriales bacterium]
YMTAKFQKLNKYVNIFVSIGAAVVIFGAWAKILHKSFADIMLTIGLLTEAAIFLLYAYLEVLAKPTVAGGKGGAVEIDVDVPDQHQMKLLSQNIAKFNDTLVQIKEVADVHAATSEYAQKTKEASVALGNMKDAYLNAANTLGYFNSAADSTKQFHEQVQVLTKNLNSLNNIYELELQGTTNHFK